MRFWVGMAVCALLLYPLSIGPAYILAIQTENGLRLSEDWPWMVVDTAYSPVERLAGATNSHEALLAYIRWWHPSIHFDFYNALDRHLVTRFFLDRPFCGIGINPPTYISPSAP